MNNILIDSSTLSLSLVTHINPCVLLCNDRSHLNTSLFGCEFYAVG